MNYAFSLSLSVTQNEQLSGCFFYIYSTIHPFKIETAFTAVSIVSFRRPIIYVESIAKTCRIGPYP